jgi:hypothetical protein
MQDASHDMALAVFTAGSVAGSIPHPSSRLTVLHRASTAQSVLMQPQPRRPRDLPGTCRTAARLHTAHSRPGACVCSLAAQLTSQAAGDLAPWCFKQSGVVRCTGAMRGPTSNTPRPWPTRRSCDTYSATSLTALDWSASSCPSAAQKPGRHISPVAWVAPPNYTRKAAALCGTFNAQCAVRTA